MIRIKEMCNAKGIENRRSGEIIKLWMRGKGSGNGEDGPLSISVSSKHYDIYAMACNLIQELIMNIYEEFKIFCAKFSRKPLGDFELQIKKDETVTRPIPMPEKPPHTFDCGPV